MAKAPVKKVAKVKVQTHGIEGFFIETHNFSKALAFYKALGFKVKFKTDHNSGELRHPAGGPYLFIAERPKSKKLEFTPVLGIESELTFKAPKEGKVASDFKKEHWGVMEMHLLDPDENLIRVHAKRKKK